MQQPLGFQHSNKSLVCRLHKAIYGLKQAPRQWFEKLKSTLVSFGFAVSRCDNSLFILNTNSYKIHVLVYVDDIVITGSSIEQIRKIITQLSTTFALKQLGTLDYFLGIEVKSLSDGRLFLSQSKYVRDLLEKANMSNAKPINSPMVHTVKLTKEGSNHLENPSLYRSIVGALQYATITRPDIAYSVNKVCQFLANPLEEHWSAVKRILRYLVGTQNHGIIFQPTIPASPLPITGFCDADWASDCDDRKSTSGACIFLGNNLITWWSKKQTTISRSSTEAEYRSMALLAQELQWVQSLLLELNFSFSAPLVLCDNLSTVSLSHNPVLHQRTKHIELDLFFVRDKVQDKKLVVKHIPANLQTADILTKALSSTRFQFLKQKLRVIDVHEATNSSSNKNSP
ncbi:hypothetical protein TanjilG_24473 [Lupinus angustifolius]|uniref:Reverse transcriptase Ty1/copia-type domain-containing protein n=1 Tax=Lupinus angustifolius TaxID=3871 RepID=A0A1J7IB40_LUPAN|nr:hypothetical protein TanjilG_24473 [Lupinus angustifolius]